MEWTPGVDFFLIALSTQISDPSCDSDIKPDQFKSLVWESHVRQQIFVVFEDFSVGKGNKFQLSYGPVGTTTEKTYTISGLC